MKRYIYSANELTVDDLWELKKAAKASSSPQELRKFAKIDHDYPWVQESVAENPNTPEDILVELAQHPESSVRVRVAGNPNTPPQALRLLFNTSQKEPWILPHVVTNPNAPLDILAECANNKTGEYDFDLLDNPNTPAKLLWQIAKRKSKFNLRDIILKHPNVTEDIIEYLKSLESSTPRKVEVLSGYSVYVWTPDNMLQRFLDKDWYSDEEIEDMGGEDALLDEAEQDFDTEFIPESDENGDFRSEGTRVGTYSTLEEAEAKANSISDRCEIWDEDSECWVV